jgi:hypothetical protein
VTADVDLPDAGDGITSAEERSAPPADGRPRTGARSLVAIGLFALAVGLLLHRAVGKQDLTDWNGAVRLVFEGLPLFLIAAGVIVLVAAAGVASRRPGAEDSADAARAANPPE